VASSTELLVDLHLEQVNGAPQGVVIHYHPVKDSNQTATSLFKYNPGPWQRIPGCFNHISMNPPKMVVINCISEMYQCTEVSMLEHPVCLHWTQVQTSVPMKQVSFKWNELWSVSNDEGKIYQKKSSKVLETDFVNVWTKQMGIRKFVWDQINTTEYSYIKGKKLLGSRHVGIVLNDTIDVAVYDNKIVVINDNGKASGCHRANQTEWTKMEAVEGVKFKSISMWDDGIVAVDRSGRLWKRDCIDDGNPFGKDWKIIPLNIWDNDISVQALKEVVIADGLIAVITNDRQLFLAKLKDIVVIDEADSQDKYVLFDSGTCESSHKHSIYNPDECKQASLELKVPFEMRVEDPATSSWKVCTVSDELTEIAMMPVSNTSKHICKSEPEWCTSLKGISVCARGCLDVTLNKMSLISIDAQTQNDDIEQKDLVRIFIWLCSEEAIRKGYLYIAFDGSPCFGGKEILSLSS
jgi:hypothetical protein